MTHYFAIVHKDPDSAWSLHFPDVPGCFSAADDEIDLLSNAIGALADNIELRDSPAPKPRTLDELKSDPEVQVDLRDGGSILLVPLLDTSSRTVRFNMTMKAALLEAVDVRAKMSGTTRSGYLASLAERDIRGAKAS